MIQLGDFAGRFRLPQNPVLQAEYVAALEQVNRRLLSHFFERATVALIMSAPADPPATTLRTLAPSIQGSCLAWAAENMQLTVTGMGVNQASSETHRRPALMWPEDWAGIVQFYDVLKEQSRYWAGEVVSVAGANVTLPAQAAVWLRAGMLFELDNASYTIANVAGSIVTLTTAPPAGVSRYRIPQLRLKTFYLINELTNAFLA